MHLSKNHEDIYSSRTPFVLSLWDEPLSSSPSHSGSDAPFVRSQHNSFVVLPPSEGSTSSSRRSTGLIQFGNVDENEFKVKKAEREERMERIRWRNGDYVTPAYETDCASDDGSAWEDISAYESDEYLRSDGDEELVGDESVPILTTMQTEFLGNNNRSGLSSDHSIVPVSMKNKSAGIWH